MMKRRMCPGHVLCVFLSSYWSVWFSISPQSTVLTQIRFTAFIALLVSLLFAEDTKIGEVQRALPCYSWKYIWNGMQSVNYGTRLQIYCNCGPLDGVLARRIDWQRTKPHPMGLVETNGEYIQFSRGGRCPFNSWMKRRVFKKCPFPSFVFLSVPLPRALPVLSTALSSPCVIAGLLINPIFAS